MAYSAVPTVATGDAWSAAQHNTYIRTNFTAAWPYTTAGDIAYASSSTALTRLGIGASGKILQVSSNLPAWGDLPNFRMSYIKRVANQNVSSGLGGTNITFDTEVVDTLNAWAVGTPTKFIAPENGLYRFTVNVAFSAKTGGIREVVFYDNFGSIRNGCAGAVPDTICFMGTEYFTSASEMLLYVYQNSGITLNVTASVLLELIG